MIELEISAASRVGCVRDNNEDMVLVGDCFIRNDDFHTFLDLPDDGRFLAAVADGMGGHNGGEVASSDALHNLHFFFGDLPLGLDNNGFCEAFVDWLESINCIFESKGIADSECRGMGTTLVCCACYGGVFYSMNCGDSRLYSFREGQLTQLTTDHSYEGMLGEAKRTSIITNCIGGGCRTSFMDIVKLDDVREGDVFLLCSDGLTDMMSDHRIEILLSEGADANALCDMAESRGGLDNVSVCKIELKQLMDERK